MNYVSLAFWSELRRPHRRQIYDRFAAACLYISTQGSGPQRKGRTGTRKKQDEGHREEATGGLIEGLYNLNRQHLISDKE
jgi:hypothetical protein